MRRCYGEKRPKTASHLKPGYDELWKIPPPNGCVRATQSDDVACATTLSGLSLARAQQVSNKRVVNAPKTAFIRRCSC